MKMTGCYRDFDSAESVLEHLEASDHAAFGLGGKALRSNGKEYYLRVYDGSSDSRYISRKEALDLIKEAIAT